MSTLASVQMSVTYKHSKSSPEAPCSYLLYIYPQISMQQISYRFSQLPYLIYIHIGREVYIIFLPIYITSDYSLAKSVINLLQPIQGVYMSNICPQISMQQIIYRFSQLPYLIYIRREVYIIFLPIYILPLTTAWLNL